MANPLHYDVNCSSGQDSIQPLSDKEWADRQADQTAITAQLQADETAWSQRRQAVRVLLQAHPELQPLVDLLRLRLT